MHLENATIHDIRTGARIVYALLEMLDDAVAAEDRVAMLSLMDFLADTLAAIGRGLEIHASGLAGRKRYRPSWQDMSPDQLLDDLRTMISIEQALIEARQDRIPHVRHASAKRLSSEIKAFLQKLRIAVLERRTYLLKHFPEYWTEAVEKEFGPWL